MKKYRTYEISGKTAYAAGQKWHHPSNNTIDALIALGVTHIIWGDGSFLYIK